MLLAAMMANDRGGHRGSRRVFDAPRGTGPIVSPPRQTTRCSLLRLPAIISARSISIQTAHSAGTALPPRLAAHWRRQPRRLIDQQPGTAVTSAATITTPRVGRTGTTGVPDRSPIPSYVDDLDAVWFSDWAPQRKLWGAQSGADKPFVLKAEQGRGGHGRHTRVSRAAGGLAAVRHRYASPGTRRSRPRWPLCLLSRLPISQHPGCLLPRGELAPTQLASDRNKGQGPGA
jgi:hypothetical protein